MRLIANNLWERDQMRKLTTVFAVDQQIDRCVAGTNAAPTIPKKKEWQRKIKFLCVLREYLRETTQAQRPERKGTE